MRDKQKLNLQKLDELLAENTWRKVFIFMSEGMPAAGAGLAAGGYIISLLAIVGITAAFIYELITAVAGAAVFGVLAVVIAGVQLSRERTKINQHKKELHEKIVFLKSQIVDLINNYQILEEEISSFEQERQKVKELLEVNQVEHEKKRADDELASLDEEIESFKLVQRRILEQLKITLELMSGESNTAKLSDLFKTPYEVGQDAVYDYALLEIPENRLPKFKEGLDKVWSVINEPLSSDNRVDRYRDELASSIVFKKDRLTSHLKRASYTMAGVGGFIGGGAATIATAALILGGMAAVLAAGWPVLVAAIAIGIVAMVGAVVYYNFIEKRQVKTFNRVLLAKEQVNAAGSYLDKNANQYTKENIQILKHRHERRGDVTKNYLDLQRTTFLSYERVTDKNHKTAMSLMTEWTTFKTYDTVSLQKITELQKSITRNINQLEGIKDVTDSIAVIGCKEEVKEDLQNKINTSLKKALEDQEKVNKIHHEISLKLHPAPVNEIKPLEERVKQNLAVKSTAAPEEDSVLSVLKKLKDEDDDDSEGEGEGRTFDYHGR